MDYTTYKGKSTGAQIDNAVSKVATLETDVTTLKTDVSQLQTDASEVETDVERIKQSLGAYTARPDITLTPSVTGYAVSADGVKTAKSGYAIAEFTAELGNEYLFKPGVNDGSVCLFAEMIDKVETRAIDYAYTYDTSGRVATAKATYLGVTHTYTYTYDDSGNVTITDDSGSTVTSLPAVFTTQVGSYQPLTILNASAELPKDGYCRFVSNFQARSSIKVAVSYKVGVADLTMKVVRDGMTASMCTQLSRINQKVDEVAERQNTMWVDIVSSKDTAITIDGVKREIKANRTTVFRNFTSIDVCRTDAPNPKCIKRMNFHYNGLAPMVEARFGSYYKPSDEDKTTFYALPLTSLDVSGWNTSNMTNMNNMFYACPALTNLDVSGWDTRNATGMRCTFYNCFYINNLDISGWNTSKVTDMAGVFNGCHRLDSLDVSGWDTSKVTIMDNMFIECSALTSLDISKWDLSKVVSLSNMFRYDTAITTLKLGEGFGKMKDAVGTLDLSSLARWTDESVQTLLSLYDRASNGMGVITIKLSSATKTALGEDGITTLTAKGYTIA